MILASVTDADETWLDNWLFDALPRVGEQVILTPDCYEVIAIEHWPELASLPDANLKGPRVRLRVKELPHR